MPGPLRAVAALGVVLGAGWRVKDHDVANPGMGGQTVDEDPLTDVQRRDHRYARDAVRLDHQRLDQERRADGHRDGDDQLNNGPILPLRRLGATAAGSLTGSRSSRSA